MNICPFASISLLGKYSPLRQMYTCVYMYTHVYTCIHVTCYLVTCDQDRTPPCSSVPSLLSGREGTKEQRSTGEPRRTDTRHFHFSLLCVGQLVGGGVDICQTSPLENRHRWNRHHFSRPKNY